MIEATDRLDEERVALAVEHVEERDGHGLEGDQHQEKDEGEDRFPAAPLQP
ncbi:hypothetical protein [Streptomyces sp. SD15]